MMFNLYIQHKHSKINVKNSGYIFQCKIISEKFYLNLIIFI